MSPTARSLAQLRKDGWLPATVEKFNPGARVRQDLFGFIDIVAIRPDGYWMVDYRFEGVLGLQVTTTAHMADRLTKMATAPVSDRVRAWLHCGNPLEIWGWSKKGPRGKRKTWTLTRREVTLRDLERNGT